MAIPAVLGALGRVAAVGGRVASAAGAEAAGSKLVQLAGNITQVSFAAQAATGAASKLVLALLPVTSHIQILVGGLNLFKDVVTSIGASVADFVKLASPIHVQQFQLAVEDFTASIGKVLIPVLEFGTRIVRFFADVIFALSDPLQRLVSAFMKPVIALLDNLTKGIEPLIPIIGKIINSMASFVESLFRYYSVIAKVLSILPIGRALMFWIDTFVKGLETTAVIIETGAAAFEMFVTILEELFETVKNFTDIRIPGLGRGEESSSLARTGRGEGQSGGLQDSSRGAAVRAAQIGSVEDYGRKAQQAAFSLGTTATSGMTPEERTARATESISTNITKLPEEMAQRFVSLLLKELFKKDTIKETVKEGEARATKLAARVGSTSDTVARALEYTFGIELPKRVRIFGF